MKKCPYCSQAVKDEDMTCQYCGKNIPANKDTCELLEKRLEIERKHLETLHGEERSKYLKRKKIKETAFIIITVLILLAGVVMVFMFMSWVFSGCTSIFTTSDSNGSETSYVSTVSASRLVDDFESNESSAKNKYSKVIVTGTIEELMDSVLSSVDVVLGTNDSYTFVKANTPDRYLDDKVAALKVGDYVKLECRDARWDYAKVNILLSSCEVQ